MVTGDDKGRNRTVTHLIMNTFFVKNHVE